MTIQLDHQIEVTITASNAWEFVERGYRFLRNVPAEQLVDQVDEQVGRLGFDAVLVGEVVKLCDGLPWEGRHDGSLFSIFTKEQAIPSPRTR